MSSHFNVLTNLMNDKFEKPCFGTNKNAQKERNHYIFKDMKNKHSFYIFFFISLTWEYNFVNTFFCLYFTEDSTVFDYFLPTWKLRQISMNFCLCSDRFFFFQGNVGGIMNGGYEWEILEPSSNSSQVFRFTYAQIDFGKV